MTLMVAQNAFLGWFTDDDAREQYDTYSFRIGVGFWVLLHVLIFTCQACVRKPWVETCECDDTSEFWLPERKKKTMFLHQHETYGPILEDYHGKNYNAEQE